MGGAQSVEKHAALAGRLRTDFLSSVMRTAGFTCFAVRDWRTKL